MNYEIVFINIIAYAALEKALGNRIMYVTIQPDENIDKQYTAIVLDGICFVPSVTGGQLF